MRSERQVRSHTRLVGDVGHDVIARRVFIITQWPPAIFVFEFELMTRFVDDRVTFECQHDLGIAVGVITNCLKVNQGPSASPTRTKVSGASPNTRSGLFVICGIGSVP